MIVALLIAFSSMPVSHGPRKEGESSQLDRPFFVGEMLHLVRQDQLPWLSSETATPVMDDAQTRLYIGTHDGKVRCRFRGKNAWIFQAVGAVLAGPALSGETLLVPGGDGVLYGLNRFTGEPRWQADLHEELTVTPAISEGRAFTMSSAQSINAVDIASGKVIWKFHHDPPGGFTIRGDARPAIAHGTVFAGFADGTVAALGTADGVARWSRQVGTAGGEYLDVDGLEAPENDTRVYAASAKAGIVALDQANGDPIWTAPLPGANHVIVDGPRVIGAGRGELQALDRLSGKPIWRVALGRDRYSTQPVIMNGIVLVARDRGPLLGIDAQTGEPRGEFDPGTGFSQAVLALPGVAYIVSNGGALFSLGLLP